MLWSRLHALLLAVGIVYAAGFAPLVHELVEHAPQSHGTPTQCCGHSPSEPAPAPDDQPPADRDHEECPECLLLKSPAPATAPAPTIATLDSAWSHALPMPELIAPRDDQRRRFEARGPPRHA